MKCDIIRDLLPSYVDGLTSETSNAAIEEHIKECEECSQYLEAMKKEVVSERYVEKTKQEIKEDIKPFKKIKRNIRQKIAVTVLLCFAIFIVSLGLYASYYSNVDGRQPDHADVEITYEKKENGVVTIGFHPKKENTYIECLYSEAENRIFLVERVIRPFEKPQTRDACFTYTFVNEDTVVGINLEGGVTKLSGEEVLSVEFGDQTKEVKIIDLYTEEGIESLK